MPVELEHSFPQVSVGNASGGSWPGRKTARELVADYLRAEILKGSLRPGERVAVAEVAAELDVSQTPARQALQQLAGEGLLRINSYRGAHVAELTAEEYEELFVARVGLESLAARLGAEAIDDAGVGQMRVCLAAMERAAGKQDVDAFLEADRAFHRTHYLASGRERLWQRVIELRYAAERYTRIGYGLRDVGMTDVVARHARLLEAVERRDGEKAGELIARDLQRTYETVSLVLRQRESDSGVPGVPRLESPRRP